MEFVLIFIVYSRASYLFFGELEVAKTVGRSKKVASAFLKEITVANYNIKETVKNTKSKKLDKKANNIESKAEVKPEKET